MGLRLVAQYADGWNFSGDGGLDAFIHKQEVLSGHLVRLRRDPTEVTISAQFMVERDLRALRDDVIRFVSSGCRHVILYLDPEAGIPGLERVVQQVVVPVRESFG